MEIPYSHQYIEYMQINPDGIIYGKKKIAFMILLAVVIVVDVIIVYTIGRFIFSNDRSERIFIKKVKNTMIKKTILNDFDLETINQYSFNHGNSSPHEQFNSWDSNVKSLEKLCLFGFKLLEYYGYNEKPFKYLQIVEDIILRIDKALTNVSKMEVLENDDDKINTEGLTVYPWGTNWYPFSVYIPKLMTMYEYIGKNNCIKQYVCHKNIIRLIPVLNKSLDIFRDGANLAYIALPRLLTNYLYDRETYEKDKKTEEYEKLINVYNINFLDIDQISNGMYEDGSYIFHKNIATYSYLVTLCNFYEEVFIIINGKSQLREIMEPLLGKLLHPTIPYITFGLFGRNGDRKSKDWWGIKGQLGLAIIPFIGLGLFKTERFMFSLRIQRPGIAAYETDIDCKGEFALGWIQLRKMYLTQRDYSNPLTWQILKNEPGIMSVVGEEFKQLLPEKKDYTVQSYMCENIKNSFIGRLINPELMFWRNQYKFSIMYECFIVEMGVVTSNGFEIYYYIDNTLENRILQFRVIDNDIKPDDKIKITVEGAEIVDGFIQIDPHKKTEFIWRLLFDDVNKTVIENDKQSNNMIFYYDTNKYVVELQKNPKRRSKIFYFTVSCFNSDNRLLYIIGGSSNSKINDSMKNGDKVLKREPLTLMYIES